MNHSVSTPSAPPHLAMLPSPLRPKCAPKDRIFLWQGTRIPPPSTIPDPWISALEHTASQASLSDSASYGSGLMKFHIFCDLFSIPETDRLPASFEVLHSFALWATADPGLADIPTFSPPPTSPIAESTVHKYLSAIRAWHIVQGWPPPLDGAHLDRINWSLRGMAKLQAGRHRKPLRPPVTTSMLRMIRNSLDISTPFDACVWAIASCSFWGMMRLGETTVHRREDFHPSRCLTRGDAVQAADQFGRPYIRLDLPSAKTAKPGTSQSVWIVPQGDLCAVEALRNLAQVVPACRTDPLFSWRDNDNAIRPMAKPRVLERINTILSANHAPRTFGHSFRIGGASFYMANKVDPEIVRIAGRWRSLAYETYIRSFEQVISRHLEGLPTA